MKDQELLERALPLYEAGLGIDKIRKELGSSNGRVRKLLREHGVDTKSRAPCIRGKREHPYDLVAPMTEFGLTVMQVASSCEVAHSLVWRWRKEGLAWEKADEVALACGYMPQDFWDDWFDFE